MRPSIAEPKEGDLKKQGSKPYSGRLSIYVRKTELEQNKTLHHYAK